MSGEKPSELAIDVARGVYAHDAEMFQRDLDALMLEQQGTYRQGLEDALRIAIPIATCSCADRLVEAIRKQLNRVAAKQKHSR